MSKKITENEISDHLNLFIPLIINGDVDVSRSFVEKHCAQIGWNNIIRKYKLSDEFITRTDR